MAIPYEAINHGTIETIISRKDVPANLRTINTKLH